MRKSAVNRVFNQIEPRFQWNVQNIVLNYTNEDSLRQAFIELPLHQKSGLKFGVIKKLMVVDGPLYNDVWMVKFLLIETGKLIKVIFTFY